MRCNVLPLLVVFAFSALVCVYVRSGLFYRFTYTFTPHLIRYVRSFTPFVLHFLARFVFCALLHLPHARAPLVRCSLFAPRVLRHRYPHVYARHTVSRTCVLRYGCWVGAFSVRRFARFTAAGCNLRSGSPQLPTALPRVCVWFSLSRGSAFAPTQFLDGCCAQ